MSPVALRFRFTLVGLLLLAGTAGAADEPAGPPYRERPGMPPAPVRAADDPLARSPAARPAIGPYVSTQVNVDLLGQNILGDAANEPSIAVNPTDPDNLVIGYRQFDSVTSDFREAGRSVSLDGGRSWRSGVVSAGTFRSDPVLEYDSTGALYYQSVMPDLLNVVSKSVDGGLSWGASVPAFGGDKNWMTVDRSGGIGDGHVYGIWQRFAGCCGERTLTRSTDGGAGFEDPVEVPAAPSFGTLAVGPGGELHAAGIAELPEFCKTCFVSARSDDAQDSRVVPTFTGQTLPIEGEIILQPGTGPNPGGLNGQFHVAVDRSNGPGPGNVYVLASLDPAGPDPLDVVFLRSTDGGTTWSDPIAVNDDPPGNWNWFGALSVAPNGRLDAIWADTRNTPGHDVSELFYAYSTDLGLGWSASVAVSPPFDSTLGWPQQNKIGDYYTIVSDAAGAHAAYAATFNGEQDVYHVRLFPDCNGNGSSDVTDVDRGASPDCNANTVPDECEVRADCFAAGAVPDGDAVPGAPLLLDRPDAGTIALGWSGSCAAGDTDYAVYEGAIGDFAAHSPVVCSTGGETTLALAPGGGDRYFLVVPQNSTHEGSYGTDGAGNERPHATVPCRLQTTGACR